MTTETQTEVQTATTSSLTRTLTLTVTQAAINAATEKRLQRMSKTVKVDGFRPGKVPLAKVKQMYGSQASWEALNDQVGEEFAKKATEDNLRVAGMPNIEPEDSTDANLMAFKATFEVYPEINDIALKGVEIEAAKCDVSEDDVTRTIDVLRQQRVSYQTADKAAAKDDQVTIDFEGKIDDVAFAGGSATDYPFVLGQGRMLPEFETAIEGLKAGESRTFDLPFPDDYHGKDVAGKTAQFTVTVKSVGAAQLPELNTEFAKALGVPDGDVEKMKLDIKTNLAREIGQRTKAMTKNNVMDALIKVANFDVPTALVNEDIERLQEGAKNDLRQRGIPVEDTMTLPTELFKDRAERRVRLGLLIADLVKKNNLHATADQVKVQVEAIAAAYEDPQGFVKWYMTDANRMSEVEAVVMEDNVVAWATTQAKMTTKDVAFEELMNQNR
ncbi:MAG: trigger factor [Formosimonas sp.]